MTRENFLSDYNTIGKVRQNVSGDSRNFLLLLGATNQVTANYLKNFDFFGALLLLAKKERLLSFCAESLTRARQVNQRK